MHSAVHSGEFTNCN